MPTTQRPTAALFEVTEYRQALLVLSGAPEVAGHGGVVAPSSMLVTYRRLPEGGPWVAAAIDLLGHTLEQPGQPAKLQMHAAGAFGPAWVRELAAEHCPHP